MRKSMMIAMFCTSTSAFAGAASQQVNTDSSGIITPDVATDGYRTERYGRDVDGNTVICPSFGPDFGEVFRPSSAICTDKNGNTKWKYPQHTVPKGKTYVGFKFVTVTYSAYIEVYWK